MNTNILHAIESVKTLRNNADNAVTNMREYIRNNPKATKDEVTLKFADVIKAVKALNDEYIAQTFATWLNMDDSILSALTDGYVPTMSATLKFDKKNNDKPSVSTATVNKRFNLCDLKAYADDNSIDCDLGDEWISALANAYKAIIGKNIYEQNDDAKRDSLLSAYDIESNYDCGQVNANDRYTTGNIDRCLQTLLDKTVYVERVGKSGKATNQYQMKNYIRNRIVAVTTKLGARNGEIKYISAEQFGETITSMFCMIVCKMVKGEAIATTETESK